MLGQNCYKTYGACKFINLKQLSRKRVIYSLKNGMKMAIQQLTFFWENLGKIFPIFGVNFSFPWEISSFYWENFSIIWENFSIFWDRLSFFWERFLFFWGNSFWENFSFFWENFYGFWENF